MQPNPQEMLQEAIVDLAVTTTAAMFALPKATVVKIVQVGMPMMAQLAEANPEVRKRLQTIAIPTLPLQIKELYAWMARDPAVRQSVMDDYRAAFGGMLDAVNREAGRQAGTTDGQAREVIAAVLPAWSYARGKGRKERDHPTPHGNG